MVVESERIGLNLVRSPLLSQLSPRTAVSGSMAEFRLLTSADGFELSLEVHVGIQPGSTKV